jgi:3',5'-nucleoside bisphosphate phosphatase
MIDLHTHSTASDGTLSPEALIDLAADKGISVLALTDHDTLAGIQAALERGRQRGVQVIPGVELGAQWSLAGQMHILGYYVDYQDSDFLDRLSWLKERRRERAQAIVKRLGELGAPLAWDALTELAGTGPIGRPHVAKALVQAGYVQSVSEAFERYLKNGAPAFLEKVQYTSSEVVGLIRRAGGVAVLAHPSTLKLSSAELQRCVEQLISEGLRGIEVYWSKHTEAEAASFLELAHRYGLIATGGSDFHGSNKPGIELGARFNGRIDESALVEALQRESGDKSRLQGTGDRVKRPAKG